jgi:hypothetical protein
MEQQLKQVLTDLCALPDPPAAPYGECLIIALYSLLTYSGCDSAVQLIAACRDVPASIRSLVEAAQQNRSKWLDLLIRNALDTTEIPRFRSSILTQLTEKEILKKFLFPLLEARSGVWEPLILLTAIVATFHLHVLAEVPGRSYSLLVRHLCDLNRSDWKQDEPYLKLDVLRTSGCQPQKGRSRRRKQDRPKTEVDRVDRGRDLNPLHLLRTGSHKGGAEIGELQSARRITPRFKSALLRIFDA